MSFSFFLSDIRKLMDVSFFLVVFHPLTYGGNEVDMVAHTCHVETGAGLVAAGIDLDADGDVELNESEEKKHTHKTRR